MRRRGTDHAVMSAAALAIVVTAMAGFDERMRQAIVNAARDVQASDVMRIGTGAYDVGALLLTGVAEQSIANAPLVIFVVIAAALTLFMVRT